MSLENIEITTTLGQEVINVTIDGYSILEETLKLEQLKDVEIVNPQDGETIVRDGIKWKNKRILTIDSDYNCLIGEE